MYTSAFSLYPSCSVAALNKFAFNLSTNSCFRLFPPVHYKRQTVSVE